MQFVDTNIFIRYLINDDPDKAGACRQLFELAKLNQVSLTTSESIIAEIVYVLSSKRLYNLARQDVRIRLYPLLSLPGLKLAHRSRYLRALNLYSNNNVDFEDALTLAAMESEQITELYSYDEDFDSVKECAVVRVEP
ncbi:MAG: PIN domain-containing protein [Anaerolineales bacterium]|nr:PIN domain-containing protein [Anaerolineales bacterium]